MSHSPRLIHFLSRFWAFTCAFACACAYAKVCEKNPPKKLRHSLPSLAHKYCSETVLMIASSLSRRTFDKTLSVPFEVAHCRKSPSEKRKASKIVYQISRECSKMETMKKKPKRMKITCAPERNSRKTRKGDQESTLKVNEIWLDHNENSRENQDSNSTTQLRQSFDPKRKMSFDNTGDGFMHVEFLYRKMMWSSKKFVSEFKIVLISSK